MTRSRHIMSVILTIKNRNVKSPKEKSNVITNNLLIKLKDRSEIEIKKVKDLLLGLCHKIKVSNMFWM